MDNETAVIREQMEETRTSLQDKLETLEQQVTATVQQATDTVQHATETVSETVDNVKEAVKETVGAVKESLDLGRQMDRHPWAMLLGAAAAGFVAGRLLHQARASPQAGYEPHDPGTTSVSLGTFQAEPPPAHTMWDSLADQFKDELGLVKGLAIGTVGGVVREMLTASAPPPLVPQIKEIVDSMTTKLGGHAVEGSILNLLQPSEQPSGWTRQRTAGSGI